MVVKTDNIDHLQYSNILISLEQTLLTYFEKFSSES